MSQMTRDLHHLDPFSSSHPSLSPPQPLWCRDKAVDVSGCSCGRLDVSRWWWFVVVGRDILVDCLVWWCHVRDVRDVCDASCTCVCVCEWWGGGIKRDDAVDASS